MGGKGKGRSPPHAVLVYSVSRCDLREFAEGSGTRPVHGQGDGRPVSTLPACGKKTAHLGRWGKLGDQRLPCLPCSIGDPLRACTQAVQISSVPLCVMCERRVHRVLCALVAMSRHRQASLEAFVRLAFQYRCIDGIHATCQ